MRGLECITPTLNSERLLGLTDRQAAPVAKNPNFIPPLENLLIAAAHPSRGMVSMTSPKFPTEVTVC
jgi:hypothetical protein